MEITGKSLSELASEHDAEAIVHGYHRYAVSTALSFGSPVTVEDRRLVHALGQDMPIDTGFLIRCITTLESAFEQLRQRGPDDAPLRHLSRPLRSRSSSSCWSSPAGLLKKRLRPYFASNRQADRLTFKDVFRHAAKHGLISVEACERWCVYRDNRNDTAHGLR